MKYRIVEYTNPFGTKKYEIEAKFFYIFWTSPYPEGYNKEYASYEAAEKGVDILRSFEYTVTNKTVVRK
jgi:hypothetical protein